MRPSSFVCAYCMLGPMAQVFYNTQGVGLTPSANSVSESTNVFSRRPGAVVTWGPSLRRRSSAIDLPMSLVCLYNARPGGSELFVCSAMRRTLAELDRPQQVLDMKQAVLYLRDVGSLWAESDRGLQRQFVREVFQRIVVGGQEIESMRRRKCTRRSSCWIGKNALEVISVDWLPGQVSNQQYYKTLTMANP